MDHECVLPVGPFFPVSAGEGPGATAAGKTAESDTNNTSTTFELKKVSAGIAFAPMDLT